VRLLLAALLLAALPAFPLSREAQEFMAITKQLEPVQCEKRRLRREIALAEAVGESARGGLQFMPAGSFGAEPPPFGRLAALLEQAGQRFGKVVVDLPPVLVAPSLVVPWCAVVDHSYLVLRRAVTPVGLVRRALNELRGGRTPQLILNRTADRPSGLGVLGLV